MFSQPCLHTRKYGKYKANKEACRWQFARQSAITVHHCFATSQISPLAPNTRPPNLSIGTQYETTKHFHQHNHHTYNTNLHSLLTFARKQIYDNVHRALSFRHHFKAHLFDLTYTPYIAPVDDFNFENRLDIDKTAHTHLQNMGEGGRQKVERVHGNS